MFYCIYLMKVFRSSHVAIIAPQEGMNCDVPVCPVFNKSYRKYMKHWKNVHSATVKMLCRKVRAM